MRIDNIALLTATDAELRRTKRPSEAVSDFLRDKDILRCVGSWSVNMETALSGITPTLKLSFKNAAINFIDNGDYSPSVYQQCFSSIGNSLKQYASECFDDSWLAKAIESPVFRRNIGPIRHFLFTGVALS
ncbi:MAG: hypothetical protein ACI9XK_000089 [Granulosicoccus sp.]|jgi:hypothetical protein